MSIWRANMPGNQEPVKSQDTCLPESLLLLKETGPCVCAMQSFGQHQTTENGEAVLKRDLCVSPEFGRQGPGLPLGRCKSCADFRREHSVICDSGAQVLVSKRKMDCLEWPIVR